MSRRRDEPADDQHRLASPSSHAALLARWLLLTRETLPGMAHAQGWPIRLDHCFMRVCLDAALGARWDTIVPRPAIRHLSEAQLGRAVAQAEAIAAQPHLLPQLNQASLRLRRQARDALAQGATRPT